METLNFSLYWLLALLKVTRALAYTVLVRYSTDLTLDNQVNYREWIKKLHAVYTELEYAHRETEDWIELAIQEVTITYTD